MTTIKRIIPYLQIMVEREASDLYFIPGGPASIKINGVMHSINDERLNQDLVKEIAYEIMSDEQIAAFEQTPEMNLALSEHDVGRFRVNIYRQRSNIAMVFRHIKTEIPSMQSLTLPPILSKLVMEKRGLLLFVGATGTGKSTSLASIIDYRNKHSAGHIITVEDPIEFVHSHQKSLITQREVGVDTHCYQDALKNALRQAPDAILIGEIRDQETMEHALTFSETGHLCMATLHANNSNQALERIVNFFPEIRHKHLLLELSLNLVGIVSQRLMPSVNKGRVPAFEILIGTPLARDLIKRNEMLALKELMGKSKQQGMQTFDAALIELYESKQISLEEALRNADSQNNVRLAISLKNKDIKNSGSELAIEDDSKLDEMKFYQRESREN